MNVVIKDISFADIKEAEKQINNLFTLDDVSGQSIIDVKFINNGHNSSIVLTMYGDIDPEVIPTAKVFDYSLTDSNKIQDEINKLIDFKRPIIRENIGGILPVIYPVDNNKIVVIYNNY